MSAKTKHKYRCGRKGCRTIHHLNKRPEEYVKTRLCDCGGTLHDYSNERKRNKIKRCDCDGYAFPHQRGSSVWCIHSKRLPTDEEYRERAGYC